MVDFKPKTDVRKVQLTGGATYTISLPKKWVIMHGVQPRDPIQMEWRPSGDLRISPLGEDRRLRQKVVLDMQKVPSAGLLDYLIAAYLTGVSRIHIEHPEGMSRDDRRVVRDFLRRTRGFDIVDENENNTELICLLDAAELSMYDLVKGAEMGLSMELNVDVQQCKDIIQNGKAWFKTKNLDAYIKLLSDGDEDHGTSDQGPSKLIL